MSAVVQVEMRDRSQTFRPWSPMAVAQMTTCMVFATALVTGLIAGAGVRVYSTRWNECKSKLIEAEVNKTNLKQDLKRLRTVDLELCPFPDGSYPHGVTYEPLNISLMTGDASSNLSSIADMIYNGTLAPSNLSYLPEALPMFLAMAAPRVTPYNQKRSDIYSTSLFTVTYDFVPPFFLGPAMCTDQCSNLALTMSSLAGVLKKLGILPAAGLPTTLLVASSDVVDHARHEFNGFVTSINAPRTFPCDADLGKSTSQYSY